MSFGPEEWIDQYLGCPRCSSSTPQYWTHRNCGGRTQISNYANKRCSRCYLTWKLRDSTYSCCGYSSFNENEKIKFGEMVETVSSKIISTLRDQGKSLDQASSFYSGLLYYMYK